VQDGIAYGALSETAPSSGSSLDESQRSWRMGGPENPGMRISGEMKPLEHKGVQGRHSSLPAILLCRKTASLCRNGLAGSVAAWTKLIVLVFVLLSVTLLNSKLRIRKCGYSEMH